MDGEMWNETYEEEVEEETSAPASEVSSINVKGCRDMTKCSHSLNF
jgi:hypothetical protein